MEVLSEDKESWSETRIAEHAVTAAPRGVAKTTTAKAIILHDIAYVLERCILIISAEQSLAVNINDDIRNMIMDKDAEFWRLYGPFKIIGEKKEYGIYRDGYPPIGMAARSFGSAVRGFNFKSIRPTKILLDDCESPKLVRNPEQRRYNWDFLHKDVLKAGQNPQKSVYVYWNGTNLHPDSTIANLLKAPGWKHRFYKSIIEWPVHKELWEKCREIWSDLANPYREAEAERFYEDNKEKMEEGCVLLDPVSRPIFDLYRQIWTEGMRSFLTEMQNEPTDPNSQYFDVDSFKKCKVEDGYVLTSRGSRIPLSSMRKIAFLDAIPGVELNNIGSNSTGAGQGDFAAIAVLAREPGMIGKNNYTYVIDVWRKRARDTEQLQAMWDICEKWGIENIGIEANGFQRLFGRDFVHMRDKRRQEGKFWAVKVTDVPQSLAKEERIARLEVPLHNGWLEINSSISEDILKEFREFPTSQHDDGSDAIASAYELIKMGTFGSITERVI